MLYTTQVLDSAVKTINALHNTKLKFDMGISLGDTCNTTQLNETRWYLDIMDGKNGTHREQRGKFNPTFHDTIRPSSGAHIGEDSIDYLQLDLIKPFHGIKQ